MNDSISKGEIIHAVNAEVNKPKKVRYKLHTPIEEVVIEFDEKEEVTSIDHILSDSIPMFAEAAEAYKEWTGEDMGKSDLISRAEALAYPLSFDHYDKENGSREFICGVESYREYIQGLPSVSVESKETENKYDCDIISRADAIEAVENNSYGMGSRASVKAIKALPSAERVVRCKDCEYAEVKEKPIKGMWCTRFTLHDMAVGDNCFCSWAKMKGADDV